MEKVKIDIDEQKRISIEILKNVKSFCEQNNITFFIAYGTLLGAVRHGGFIPWDDDIDIIMLRNDYDKFINSYKNSLYKCLSFENNNFYFPYAKVIDTRTFIKSETVVLNEPIGVGIDIFPIDYISDDMGKAKMIKRRFFVQYTLLRYSLYNNLSEISNKSFAKILVYYFSKIFGFSFWKNEYKKKLKKFTCEKKRKYCALLPLINSGAKPIFNSEIFDTLSEYSFEDMSVPSVHDYDQFLSTVYGDYMTIPPVEKRITHDNKAYYK